MIPGLGGSAGEGIGYPLQYSWASLVAQLENPPAMRIPGFYPWVGKIPWRREWLCQYSGLENSMDFVVHEVAKSWTGLSNFQKKKEQSKY